MGSERGATSGEPFLMRLTAFFATVVLIPFAAHCVWGAEPGNDHRLDEFFGAYLDRWFALRPLDATRLGDHRFDHRLDDLSPGARAQWIALMRETLEALPEQVDYRALTRSGQIDFEILRHELVKSLWLAENARPYEEDPRIYNDYISDSVFLLLTQSSLPKETNITNALARMEQIPQVIAAARANLRNPPAAMTCGIAHGTTSRVRYMALPRIGRFSRMARKSPPNT